MDSDYILTPVDELQHAGIKGMRWGIRRYQNKDGSLTPAGRKRYNEETAKLKEREKAIANREKVKTKMAKLNAKKAELDAREAALKGGKGSAKTDNVTAEAPKHKKISEMTDQELQTKLNRLRNEDAYGDLAKKLGKFAPETEIDAKIASMEKQKKYLELQRDIKNLTPEKTSLAKKLTRSIMNDIVGPAAKEAGKNVLQKYLTESGYASLEKKLGDEVQKAAKTMTKANEKQAKKEAKAAAKEAKKEAKAAEKEAKKEAETSSSTYHMKSGEKTYVNSNGDTKSVFTRLLGSASNTTITSLSTTNSSRGSSTADRHKNDTVYDLLDRDGNTIITYGDDD